MHAYLPVYIMKCFYVLWLTDCLFICQLVYAYFCLSVLFLCTTLLVPLCIIYANYACMYFCSFSTLQWFINTINLPVRFSSRFREKFHVRNSFQKKIQFLDKTASFFSSCLAHLLLSYTDFRENFRKTKMFEKKSRDGVSIVNETIGLFIGRWFRRRKTIRLSLEFRENYLLLCILDTT